MGNKAVKKALSFILALCLPLTLASFSASAREAPLGAGGEIVDSSGVIHADKTPASPAGLAESLPQGAILPQSIHPDHYYIVGENSYATLAEAIAAVPDGGTIKLQKSDNRTVPATIRIEKDITFDLTNGNLEIFKSGGQALEVKDCTVSVTGGGHLDVEGGVGILADNATITVRNVTGNQGRGAYAVSGGKIHVTGDVKGATEAVFAYGEDSVITVAGSAASTGFGAASIGAKAQSLGSIEITGGAAGAGYGIYAVNYATITVGGGVTATGSDGAAAFVTGNSTATIDGAVSGDPFIVVGGTRKDASEKTTPTTRAGYDTYTSDGASTVWVKITDAQTPLATPTGLAWDTATEGAVKAEWNPVADAERYTIMLFKDGSPVGPIGTNATGVYLTQYIRNSGTGSYTFTVRALAPSGSADYTDSVTSLQSPPYIYTAPAAVPAEGAARANLYTKSIFVTLSQGGFSAAQDNACWILGGDGASGTTIAGVTFISSTEVQITLANDINAIVQLTITASQDAFAAGTAPFSSPLAVRLDNPPAYVCTIDGAAYPSLKSALAFALADAVDNKTIVLEANIRYEEPVVVEGKTITFNLNGKNLIIDTSETVTGDWLTASALKVDRGSISYTGEGSFTVCGERRGVEAINGGRARVSEILIKNPGSPYPKHYYVYGAYAQGKNDEDEGSQITVTDGIRTLGGNPCDYAAGALAGQDSTVTVGGNIFIEGNYACGLAAGGMNDGNAAAVAGNVTVKGESATGVKAAGKSIATVNGAVTAMGAYAVGVNASIAEDGSGGTVIVKGDAAATGAESTGVICFSGENNPVKSLVSVDGTVSGGNYLNIDNAVRAKNAKDSVAGGYWIYNGQYESVVKVKDADGGTPGGIAPSAPENLTAVPGNGRVTLSWSVPASIGDSAITGYQVSGNGGESWTTVGLTISYTFINLANGTEYTFKVRAVNSAGSGAEASASATPSDSSQAAFTLNFYSNGALYTSRSAINGSALGDSWPANPTRSGYTFGGWFTGQNGAGTQYTSSSPVTSNLDLTANWVYGGSPGNDSDPSVAPSAPPEWLERNGTPAPIAEAKEKGLGYILTRRNSPYGVRAEAWQALAGYQYWHDTMDGSAVQVRVYVKKPGAITSDLLVSGHVRGAEAERVKTLFEKYFTNKLRTIHLDQTGAWGQSVEVAAKVDLAGMDVTKLTLYSYDKATNTYRRIENAAYWVDVNGYLHFTTGLAGDIVVSEGSLAPKNGGVK